MRLRRQDGTCCDTPIERMFEIVAIARYGSNMCSIERTFERLPGAAASAGAHASAGERSIDRAVRASTADSVGGRRYTCSRAQTRDDRQLLATGPTRPSLGGHR
jgi:hypothetical protein